MINRLEDKSIPELFESAMDVISNYNIMYEKILGSTPEEVRETQKALEGLTPAQIRDAVKLYRSGTPHEIQEMPNILGGFNPIEIREAVNLCIRITPDKIQEMNNLLEGITFREAKEALRLYRLKRR